MTRELLLIASTALAGCTTEDDWLAPTFDDAPIDRLDTRRDTTHEAFDHESFSDEQAMWR